MLYYKYRIAGIRFLGVCIFVFTLFVCLYAGEIYTLSLLSFDAKNYSSDKTIKLLISLTDEKGYSPIGLKRENFSIIDDNKIIQDFIIEPISLEKDSASIILLFDVSGSMKGEPVSKARKSGVAFIRGLEKNDRVAIHIFDTEYRDILNMTDEKSSAIKAIESIESGPNDTALNDAVFEALNHIDTQPGKRRFIILLTDGKENSSRKFPFLTNDSQDQLHPQLAERLVKQDPKKDRIPIFVVGLGEGVSKKYLQAIADKSGGKFYFAPQPKDLEDIYISIAREIRNQYFITYHLDREVDSGLHNVVVKANFKGSDQVGCSLEKKQFYMLELPLPSNNNPSSSADLYMLAGGLTGSFLGCLIFVFFNKTKRKSGKKIIIQKMIIFFILTVIGILTGYFIHLFSQI
jgi:Mg-chelatase subunit ChlD